MQSSVSLLSVPTLPCTYKSINQTNDNYMSLSSRCEFHESRDYDLPNVASLGLEAKPRTQFALNAYLSQYKCY